MKKEDLIVGKEYIANDGVRAFYRGCNSYGQPQFEISKFQDPNIGIDLGFERPAFDIASGRYWCSSCIENYFYEIEIFPMKRQKMLEPLLFGMLITAQDQGQNITMLIKKDTFSILHLSEEENVLYSADLHDGETEKLSEVLDYINELLN